MPQMLTQPRGNNSYISRSDRRGNSPAFNIMKNNMIKQVVMLLSVVWRGIPLGKMRCRVAVVPLGILSLLSSSSDPSHFTRRMVIESHVSVYDELIYSRNEHTIYMPHPLCALNDIGPGWLMALSSKHLSCIEHLKTSHSNGFDECSRKGFHSYLHFSTGSIKICIFISLYLAQLPIIRFTSQQLNSISSVTLTSLSPSDSRFIELMRKASNS